RLKLVGGHASKGTSTASLRAATGGSSAVARAFRAYSLFAATRATASVSLSAVPDDVPDHQRQATAHAPACRTTMPMVQPARDEERVDPVNGDTSRDGRRRGAHGGTFELYNQPNLYGIDSGPSLV